MLQNATTVVLVMALAVAGSTAAGLLGSVESGDAQHAVDGLAQGTEISFTRQPSDGTSVVVDEVTLPRGGFVAIHDTSAEPPDPDLVGSVIGVSRYLDAGVHTNVTITLADPVDVSDAGGSTRVIAMPHRDTNGNRVFDFVYGNETADGPYERDGTPITDPATLDLSSSPLPAEAAISFSNQSLRGTDVVVGSATLSDGGFVAILDEDGDVVGVSEYLEAETQQDVRIRLTSRPDEPTNLTARAHLDTNGDRVFGFDISDGDVDRPYPGTDAGATDTALVRPRSGDGTPTETGFGTPSPSPTRSPTPTDFGTESPTPESPTPESPTPTLSPTPESPTPESPTPTLSPTPESPTPTESPSLLALVAVYSVGIVTRVRTSGR